MGNQCFRDDTVHRAEQASNQNNIKGSKKTAKSDLYTDQLQSDRKNMIRSKEQRNRADQQKLESLLQEKAEMENSANKSKQYQFQMKKLNAKIESVQKMIKKRNVEIENIRESQNT